VVIAAGTGANARVAPEMAVGPGALRLPARRDPASGMSEDEILADFPKLEREDIRAALAFAAEREGKVSGTTAP
jgi:hypothetical protein